LNPHDSIVRSAGDGLRGQVRGGEMATTFSGLQSASVSDNLEIRHGEQEIETVTDDPQPTEHCQRSSSAATGTAQR
jgi:hypothetical protein